MRGVGGGRAGVLEQVGATTEQLPVVVTFDGRVLRDPSFAEVAEALSAPTRPAAAAYGPGGSSPWGARRARLACWYLLHML